MIQNCDYLPKQPHPLPIVNPALNDANRVMPEESPPATLSSVKQLLPQTPSASDDDYQWLSLL